MYDMESCLSIIAEYDMNTEESIAFKLCCLYQEAATKAFPHYRHSRVSKTNDPRKTLLFKYCYKLFQETKDKLKLNEYLFYMQAQMDVLKVITRDGDPPLIQPSILTGEKAWVRWLIWKKHFEKRMKKFKEVEVIVDINLVRIALMQTKKFLESRMGIITADKIKSAMKKDLWLWLARNQITPYFIILSKTVGSDIQTEIDLNQYYTNAEIEQLFKEIFQEI